MDTSKRTPDSPAAPLTPTTARSSAPAPAVSTAPAATTAPARMRARASRTIGPGLVVAGFSAALVVAALVLAYVSRRDVPAAAHAQPEAPAPSVQVAPVQPDALPAPLAVPRAADAVVGASVPKTVIEKPKQTRVAATKKSSPPQFVPPPAATGAAASRARQSEPIASAAESNPTPDHVSQAAVTITGCLETTIEGDRFRLTDTEGADAPKARGWRSGFLKKHPAPVELVELHDLPNLRKYVGNRVAATGLLTSRELRVRSLESTGPSCN